jgi:hypothetical protein
MLLGQELHFQDDVPADDVNYDDDYSYSQLCLE